MSNDKNYKLLKRIRQKKVEITEGTLETKRSFFIHSSQFYPYSMNDLLAIFSQKEHVTDLRSFDEWKENNRFILSGEKAIFLLNDYSNPQSKRKALFDVSQTSGAANVNIESQTMPIDEVQEVLQILNPFISFDINEPVENNLHDYITDIAENGLREYDKLTSVEKEFVPLVSEFTICQKLRFEQRKQYLLEQLEDTFFKDPTARFIATLQVGNNMSKSILHDFYAVRQQAKIQLVEKNAEKQLEDKPVIIEPNYSNLVLEKANNEENIAVVETVEQHEPEEKIDTLVLPKEVEPDVVETVQSEEISLFDVNEITESDDRLASETKGKADNQTEFSDFSFENQLEDIYSKGVVKKIQDNIEAVRLIKNLERIKGQATVDEQAVLSRYSGWGGIANELFDPRKDRFAGERRELRMLITPDEYRSIEDSSLTSYYTDPKFIQELWRKLEQAGFKGGAVLDPAMGTGNFFSAMPLHLKQHSELVGVEIDTLTGKIAEQLHPSATIKIQGFETTEFEDQTFDLVIGNVPFNNLKLSDSTYQNMMIHDYFFRKSMDLVREGGVLAFITSTGTMDKADHRLRESLSKEANFIAGYRLPNSAFKMTANTDVTSDLLIFQKKTKEQVLEQDELPFWVQGSVNETTPNEYFVNNPQNILGEMFIKNFNGQTLSVKESEDYLDLFRQCELPLIYDSKSATNRLPKRAELEQTIEEINAPTMEEVEPFTFSVKDGKIFYNNNKEIEEIPPRNKKTLKRVEGMIQLREEIRELIRIQKLEDYDPLQFEQQIVTVNELYDAFVNNYGNFHARENKIAFRNDDYYPLLCSVEIEYEDEAGKVKYKKSELFSHATIRPQVTIKTANNALEALQHSINNKQEVDFEYMQELYNKEITEIIDELGTEIYLNPATNKYESASEYLSGDVKTKLSLVEEEIKQGNLQFEPNRISLEKIIPPDLTLADINYQIGTTWIPEEYYIDFLVEKLKMSDYAKEHIFNIELNPSSKEYFISGKLAFSSPLVTKTYGTEARNAYQLFEDLLNFKNTTIMKTIEFENVSGNLTEKKVIDSDATLLCREKQELLRTEFKQWVEQYPSRRSRLEKIYNERFNRFVVRKYDGSSLTFGTMNQSIELRPHQKNAVQRIVTEGRGLLAHVVGSGKTLSMIASGMKLKELGLVKKPLYLVPKSLIRPFGEEILRAYPDKKVLIATDEDFKKENRKQFVSKVATGTYDAIVMGHTQFAKIPLSKERYTEFLENELNELEDMLLSCEEDSHSFKAIKGEIKRAEERIQKQLFSMDRDRILDFEDLGVDFLFVDEAHMYKNLGVRTKLGNVAGISTTSANKSMDMLAKIQFIQEENNGRGVVFATGTPISNSMCELYTMMRYLAPDILDELDVTHFDDWQGVFGEIENKLEMTPEASGYRVRERFSKFHNVPELMTQFSRFADVQTADMLNLPTPNLHKVIQETKATPMQQMKMEELAKRSERIRDGLVSPTIDNMLKITSEARRMALDPRLLSEELYGRQDSQKLQRCVENVYQLWYDNMDKKATQIIFSDIGTPSNKSFNVYDEIKEMLVEKGIPKSEIQFIHDASNDVKKEKLFKDVRTGAVRVLLGSTEKLGTGVNVQNRLIAIHNLDCPWRPSDLEQRIGRIERQGNMFDDVYSYTYITKGTFDSYLFQIQEQKLTYITQIMSSKGISRSTDDVDELVVQASEVKALATGNPLIKERADLENEVRRLNLLKSNHYQQDNTIKNEIKQAEKLIPAYEERVKKIQIDLNYIKEHESKNSFELIMDGQTFDQDVKKSEIGQLLLDKVMEIRSSSTDLKDMRHKEIATYNGFPVYFNGYVANGSDMILQVRKEAEYQLQIKSDSPISPILNLNNLAKEVEKSLKRTTTLLQEEKNTLNELKEQVGKPFERLEELSEKQQKLRLMDEAIELGIGLDELKERKENTQHASESKEETLNQSELTFDHDYSF